VTERNCESLEQGYAATSRVGVELGELQGRAREGREFAAREERELFIQWRVAELGPGVNIGEAVIDTQQCAVTSTVVGDGAQSTTRH